MNNDQMLEGVASTTKHIREVQKIMNYVIKELSDRGIKHDKSKLEDKEFFNFTKTAHKLKNMEYNSDEYKNELKNIGSSLEHHYQKNDHHPEHHKNGIKDMDLFQLLEMMVDWSASVKRMKNGSITDSLKKNRERFEIDDSVYPILKNTLIRYAKIFIRDGGGKDNESN